MREKKEVVRQFFRHKLGEEATQQFVLCNSNRIARPTETCTLLAAHNYAGESPKAYLQLSSLRMSFMAQAHPLQLPLQKAHKFPPCMPSDFRKVATHKPGPPHLLSNTIPPTFPTMLLFRAVLISFLLSLVVARRGIRISSTCGPSPAVPHTGPGCGIPEYVDLQLFGDNNNSLGVLSIRPRRSRIQLDIRLSNFSRPDHVLTAWLVWTDPTDPNRPSVFKGTVDIVSPCAPFNAAFTSGFGREPNQFKYLSRSEARLRVNLNFNPTFPGEGALARGTPCFQKDIPGIQNTELRQFPLSRGGGDVFVPTTSAFLRKYDPRTGFELLDRSGDPQVVRSPTSAMMVAVASHIDLATHGISPGAFMFDHFEIMAFPLQDVQIGRRTV